MKYKSNTKMKYKSKYKTTSSKSKPSSKIVSLGCKVQVVMIIFDLFSFIDEVRWFGQFKLSKLRQVCNWRIAKVQKALHGEGTDEAWRREQAARKRAEEVLLQRRRGARGGIKLEFVWWWREDGRKREDQLRLIRVWTKTLRGERKCRIGEGREKGWEISV